MNGLESIHDDCLEYELNILSGVEELAERRQKAYKSGKVDEFKDIKSLLENIKQDAELYKEYLDDFGGGEE